jgi:O-antigen ligase
LTLAYVALALLPLSVILTKYNWRKLYLWVILSAVLGAIYFSMSRTVQVLTLVIFAWNILILKKRVVRYAALGFMLLGIIAILGTDNLVSHRLKNMVRGGGTQWSEDTYSHYPDDRLAFWDIHWQMIKERPLIGHGVGMNQEYRRPYYEAMGLKDFKKPYEAHNQFIQIVAEGGFIAVIFFGLWIFNLFRSFEDQSPMVTEIRNQTLVVFILGGMTQNAYHDSEVRYALMVVLALGFVCKGLSVGNCSKISET